MVGIHDKIIISFYFPSTNQGHESKWTKTNVSAAISLSLNEHRERISVFFYIVKVLDFTRSRLLIEVMIERARFHNNYLWERFCFSPILSALTSRFQHSRIRALFKFFGQGHLPPPRPKSQRARTPMHVNQFPSHTGKETSVRNVTDFLMTLIVLCNGLSTLTTMFKMVEQEYDFLFVQ